MKLLCVLFFIQCICFTEISGKDLYIIGRVADTDENPVTNAKVSISANSTEYTATTGSDGSYVITIPDNIVNDPALLKLRNPYPNPFNNAVSFPLIINSEGDINFAVYDLAGRKVFETLFTGNLPGSYRINWNTQNLSRGFYIYAITFMGKTISGKLVKLTGIPDNSLKTGIEPFIFPLSPGDNEADPSRISVIATVSKTGYHSTRMTDISISTDTVLNFTLRPKLSLPFKTLESHIAVFRNNEYKKLILKGINLGVSPPGYFPGEVAYSITTDMYERWIRQMAESGFNSIRIYTLHPPVFYEKLAEYNLRHQDNPLFLFQGIWLDEIEDGRVSREYDLNERISDFKSTIREIIDCMHGNNSISFRPGKAYGEYKTDISSWIAGYIIGREVSPQEVDSTDKFHPDISSYTGSRFSIDGASASEVFVTKMLDETVNYELNYYSVSRPVSFSSWPTLDPLIHPTEIFTDEDKASIDITKIQETDGAFRLFASYHAYPYYPDFVSDEPSYRNYSDEYGPNSYLGYLTVLKNHYNDMPLVIAEFGVPSSWGSAHQAHSGMHHGGLSEKQQGEFNVRIFKNIIQSGGCGGFMFSWMDEWFKPTWIVTYLEAFGKNNGETIIPTRQLWHNLVSSEQNFGLIAFEQTANKTWHNYSFESTGNNIQSLKGAHDNAFFYVEVETHETVADGDTLILAFDTYLKETGESILPGDHYIPNRSEFFLECIKGSDSVSLYVTEAYNMFGFSVRFNLANQDIQKFKSINSDGAPWVLSKWINNGFDSTVFNLGRLPAGYGTDPAPGEREAALWSGNKLKVRIPWTMLHFYDPTQMTVNDGAETYDFGRSYEIIGKTSDGIAITILYQNIVTSSLTRYVWPSWLIVPETKERQKKSLEIISTELRKVPDYLT